MELLQGLAALLKVHGPWALVAIAGVVIWRMALYIQRLHTQHQQAVKSLLLDHNKEQKEETKQLVSAMMSTETALQSINDSLNALSSRRA